MSVVAVAAGGAVSTQPASAAGEPALEATGIAWKRCDPPHQDLECGTLAVPLDWDRPNGKKIELAVNRHRASRPGKRIGSMFVNPGGPGQSGVTLVQDRGG